MNDDAHVVPVERVRDAPANKTVHSDGDTLFFKLDVEEEAEWVGFTTDSGEQSWYHADTGEVRKQEDMPEGEEEEEEEEEGTDETKLADHAYKLLRDG